MVQSAPWLLIGFALSGVAHVWLPVSKLTRHLGRPGFASVVKSAIVGVPLPLCSCSVIPVASSLRRRGASRGAFLSFIISTPETGADSLGISYALLGPFMTLVRPIAATVTAVVAGVVLDAVAGADSPTNDETVACASGCDCTDDKPDHGRGGVVEALRFGFVEMFADLAPWLVAGFALSGLAAALIPEGFLNEHIGTGLASMLLMLVVGMPMYVCATSSTPIAATLIGLGLSPGAAIVFLLAGPATNLATMVIVLREVGRRGLAVYLLAIGLVSIIFGMLVNVVAPSFSGTPSPASAPCVADSTLAGISAVILAVLIGNGLRIHLSHRLPSSPR